MYAGVVTRSSIPGFCDSTPAVPGFFLEAFLSAGATRDLISSRDGTLLLTFYEVGLYQVTSLLCVITGTTATVSSTSLKRARGKILQPQGLKLGNLLGNAILDHLAKFHGNLLNRWPLSGI